MQDFGPQVSCLVHLLLLLLSTSLVGGQSFPHPQSGQNPYHRELPLFHSYEDWGSRQAGEKKEDILQYCDGDLDVYFVLDKSSAVREWNDVFSSWEDMVEKYLNPNMRMSFIFFDYKGAIKMSLTSDRREIRSKLSSIQTIQLAGSTLLHKGLEKANEQIQTANSGATTRSSLIIAVFWGQLSQQELDKSKEEADKARTMGAYVYCIGLDYNDKKKLNEITDNEENVFVLEGTSDLFHGLVDTIGTRTCLELRYVEPSPLCLGENRPVALRGYGFHNAKDLSQVICRFKLSDSKIINKNPTGMNSTAIICPRPDVKQVGETILVDVSLNNGRDFLAHTISVNTSDCRTTPMTTTPVPETSTQPPMTNPTVSPTNPIPGPTATLVPTAPPPPLPRPPPPPLPPLPPSATVLPPAEPSTEVLLSTMVLVLMMIPVLLWWVWWLCCRQPPKALPAPAPPSQPTKKETPPPPVPPPLPPSAPAPPPPVPIVIICCGCCCRNVYVSRGTEGNVTVCNFSPLSCHQLPVMWSQSTDQGQCTNLDLLSVLSSHVPCTSKASLPSRQEYLPLASCSQCHQLPNSYCRIHPLLSPTAQVSSRAPLPFPPLQQMSQSQD